MKPYLNIGETEGWSPFIAIIHRLPKRSSDHVQLDWRQSEALVREILDHQGCRVLHLYWASTMGLAAEETNERMIVIFEAPDTVVHYVHGVSPPIEESEVLNDEDIPPASFEIALQARKALDATGTLYVASMEHLYFSSQLRMGEYREE